MMEEKVPFFVTATRQFGGVTSRTDPSASRWQREGGLGRNQSRLKRFFFRLCTHIFFLGAFLLMRVRKRSDFRGFVLKTQESFISRHFNMNDERSWREDLHRTDVFTLQLRMSLSLSLSFSIFPTQTFVCVEEIHPQVESSSTHFPRMKRRMQTGQIFF